MELSVRGGDVLLTTHKTYCESRESDNGIQAVSQYAPFQRFIEECEQRGPAPRSITIRSIQRIAHRVVGVMADVDFVDSKGRVATQSITLKDYPSAVLLPVAVVDGQQYGILRTQRRVAASMNLTKEAYYGVVTADGTLTCEDAAALTELGFDLSAARPLAGGRSFTIGDEGQMPYTVFTVRASLTASQLQSLQNSVTSPSMCVPVAVPLAVVSSIDDTKTSLAASLLCAESA